MAAQWLDLAMDLIESQSVLTLSTNDETGPWSAPVYFVCMGGIFYFFSSPQSRHIRQALQSKRAAGSIFSQSDTWESIRGIQMAGKFRPVCSPVRSLKVIAIYLKRFPFTRTFFPKHPAPDLTAFFTTFKAKLFAFTPTQVFYVDNRFGLGTRQQIDWPINQEGK